MAGSALGGSEQRNEMESHVLKMQPEERGTIGGDYFKTELLFLRKCRAWEIGCLQVMPIVASNKNRIL